jgi:hypothetical protein
METVSAVSWVVVKVDMSVEWKDEKTERLTAELKDRHLAAT